MTNHIGRAIGAAIGLSLLGAPSAASATDFTPEGRQNWVEIMRKLVAVTHGEARDMAAPCRGVGSFGADGAYLRREFFQVPKWASYAHLHACLTFKTIATNGEGSLHKNAGDVCKGMKMAIGELAQAKPGVDPDDVVAVAGDLSKELTSLLASYKAEKACRIGG